MSEGEVEKTSRAQWFARSTILLAAFAFLLWDSAPFENCFRAIPHYEGGQQYQKGLAFLFLFGSRYVGCVGVYLDQNSGAIAAFATVVIAIYTYTLWHVGSGQLGAVLKQIDLARQEFTASHRPKIILREAFTGVLIEGQEMKVMIVLANVGETPGKIVRSIVDVSGYSADRPTPFFRTSIEPFNEIGDLDFSPGQSRMISLTNLTKRPKAVTIPIWKAAEFEPRPIVAPGGGRYTAPPLMAVHLVGEFAYIDGADIIRRTAFRRVFDRHRQRFYRIENEPDLDYSD